jgi:hypothetical protein
MQAFNDFEICEIQIGNFQGTNLEPDQLSYTPHDFNFVIFNLMG